MVDAIKERFTVMKFKKREETKRVPAPIVSKMKQSLIEVGGEPEETPEEYQERIKREARNKLKRENPFKVTPPRGSEIKRRREERNSKSIDKL